MAPRSPSGERAERWAAVERDERLESTVRHAALRVVERNAGRRPMHARAATRGGEDGPARGCGHALRHRAGTSRSTGSGAPRLTAPHTRTT